MINGIEILGKSKLDNIDPKYFHSDFIILWLIDMALFLESYQSLNILLLIYY